MQTGKVVPQPAARKLLRVATRCTTLEEFLSTFHPFVDEETLLIITSQPKAVGTRQPFVVQLKTGDNVLGGEAEVIESTAAGPTGRGSMRLKLLSMDAPSRKVHRDLLARGRAAKERAPTAPQDGVPSAGSAAAPPANHERRVPGSAFTLPANPFGELPDAALAAFVECTLYEETGLHALHDASALELGSTLAGESGGGAAPSPAPGLPYVAPQAPPLPAYLPAVPQAVPPALETMPVPRYAEPLPRPRAPVALILVSTACAAGLGFAGGFLLRGGARETPASAQAQVATPAPAPSSILAPAATPTPAPAPAGPPAPEPEPTAPPAAPAPAGIAADTCVATITSDPPAAIVTWSGRKLGPTPIEAAEVPCGDAVVVLDHPRYERVERRVTVSAGSAVTVDERLVRPTGKLSLASSPPGAVFTVGGRAVGKAPTAVEVQAFTQVSVQAELPGYKPWSQKVYVKGRAFSVHAKLEKIPSPKGRPGARRPVVPPRP